MMNVNSFVLMDIQGEDGKPAQRLVKVIAAGRKLTLLDILGNEYKRAASSVTPSAISNQLRRVFETSIRELTSS